MEQQRGKVIIAGAGLAGLAAAKTLLAAGYQVELFENRAVLGGKVSSWRDQDGDWVESGLHVFFGAYEEIYDLMRAIGIYENILWKEHVLTYTLENGGRFSFRTAGLPSPLHLAPAIIGNNYFSFNEKLLLAKAMPNIVFSGQDYYRAQDDKTYEQWHLQAGISKRMLKKMFLPMALALKFQPPEELSAKVVLDVTSIFLKQAKASQMGFLNGSPQEKLIGPLAGYIQKLGGRIHTQSGVSRIHYERGRITGLELKSGEVIRGDYYLLALPIHKLNRLIPEELRQETFFSNLAKFEGVPVITVQLWLDRQVTFINNVLFNPDGMIPVYADLANTTPDYAFGGRSRLEFVVAPAQKVWDWEDAEIVEKVWQDLRSSFPVTSAGAKVLKSTLVRIPQSVYWPRPGLDRLRPTQSTPIPNLFLAGGYTQQRFYDSMEGAVASGRRAARALIESPVPTPLLTRAN